MTDEHTTPTSEVEPQATSSKSKERLSCDLVMKGGITSGIVYPKAVYALKEDYYFKSIGGTSAGAIAAAATAAAEYGRELTGEGQGFEGLSQVSDQLAATDFLANLFQPSPQTAPLLNFVFSLIDELNKQEEEPKTTKKVQKSLLQSVKRLLMSAPGIGACVGLIFILPTLIGLGFALGRGSTTFLAVRTWLSLSLAFAIVVALGYAGRQWLQQFNNLIKSYALPTQKPTTARTFAKLIRRLPTLLQQSHADDFKHGSLVGRIIGAFIGMLFGMGYSMLSLVLTAIALTYTTISSSVVSLLFLFIIVSLFTIGGFYAGKWLGGMTLVLYALYRQIRYEIPKNFYGICTGKTTKGPHKGHGPALTDWLEGLLNKMAGTKAEKSLLTFGDLEKKDIELRMVTTNLSQKRPYILPFAEPLFIFKVGEMRKFFSEDVVNHLIDKRDKSLHLQLGTVTTSREQEYADDRFYFLPPKQDLPVIVATRLSLSFPLLLCAVPLWVINEQKLAEKGQNQDANAPIQLEEADLVQTWFSDGGISSNFPIHFFDRWYPSHPTFGINLAEKPEKLPQSRDMLDAHEPTPAYSVVQSVRPLVDRAELTTGQSDPASTQDIYLPPSELSKLPHPDTKVINYDLPRFLYSIFETAQNYRDTMQSMLPSYFDRIVTIRLASNEGGLNLKMSGNLITQLADKGNKAGMRILGKDGMPGFNLTRHRWIRLLVLLAELEEQLNSVYPSFTVSDDANADKQMSTGTGEVFARLLSETAKEIESDPDFPCKAAHQLLWDSETKQIKQEVRERFTTLEQLIMCWGNEKRFFTLMTQTDKEPTFPSIGQTALRITPNV